MRLVKTFDDDGYQHLTYVKDNDPDTANGINADPPNINDIDWEGVKRELHNKLIEHGIDTQSIRSSQSGLNSIIISVLKKRLIALYRSVENE
jgi:hypothetical protein